MIFLLLQDTTIEPNYGMYQCKQWFDLWLLLLKQNAI